ncbi:MAG: alpha/beta fold hydrolase [Acidobacteriota bacterium]
MTLAGTLRELTPPLLGTGRAVADLVSDPDRRRGFVQREARRGLRRTLRGVRYVAERPPAVGLTPHEVVHRRGTLRLLHYKPLTDEVYRVPVVVVTSLVSKPYILDLTPGHSFVEHLVRQGYDVYMVDWGAPRSSDAHLRLEDYVLDFLPETLDRVAALSGEPEVSLVGYCMGGLLATLYAAMHPQGRARNLGCFATPVDYDGMRLFKRWTDPRFVDVDTVVDVLGNVPPRLVRAGFNRLRPVSELAGRVRLVDRLWDDDFVEAHRLLQTWANDHIPFPGECFRQTTKELLQQNRLAKGTFELDARPVDLRAIEIPFLHAMAEHDHIVPLEAARPLGSLVGSEDCEDVVLKGGHVSLVAGARAPVRLWPALDQWLSTRSS